MKKVLVAVVFMMGIGSFSAFAAETRGKGSSGSSYAIHREILSGFSDPRGICCGKDWRETL